MDSPPRKRHWFQIHLLAALMLMIGLVVAKHLRYAALSDSIVHAMKARVVLSKFEDEEVEANRKFDLNDPNDAECVRLETEIKQLYKSRENEQEMFALAIGASLLAFFGFAWMRNSKA